MKLYKKEGNTVQILGFPTEEIEKGEYLLIEDFRHRRSLVIQVIDIQFANIPGILEEFLRNSTKYIVVPGRVRPPYPYQGRLKAPVKLWSFFIYKYPCSRKNTPGK